MAHWAGLDELQRAFTELSAQADATAAAIIAKGAAVAEREIKAGFSGSHKRGEPHVGGDKPNIVTGNLRRSVHTERISRVGPAAYFTRVGPTAIYGRRVELGFVGGGGGRGHQTTRAFPYFAPGAERARAEFAAIAAAEWARFRGR